MIRRELAKDPKLATESWDRFLPQFRKRHLKTSEKTAKKNEAIQHKTEARQAAGLYVEGSTRKEKPAKKVYTPFPPAQLPRKVNPSFCVLNCDVGVTDSCHSVSIRSTFNSNLESTSSSHTRKKHANQSGKNKRSDPACFHSRLR